MEEFISANIRAKIYKSIKNISDFYGGDDLEWLRGYAMDIVKEGTLKLLVTLSAFEDVESQLEYMTKLPIRS